VNVLVLYAHPVESSFNGSLHRLIVDRLRTRGHTVDDCDLYAEDFDPRLSAGEHLCYHDVPDNAKWVTPYVKRLLEAEGLVLSFPVWNYGFPAILKGFFDRVFLPGVSFKLVNGVSWPALYNIRKVAAVTTYGGSRIRAVFMGDPPRKIISRLMRVTVGPRATIRYFAHYDMDRSTEASRRAFAGKVGRAMDTF
jgi:NAD(P)H dehydrogenase (quinone)